MARRQLERYRRKGPGRTTALLIEAVVADGVAGRTFLDIGGGVGAVQHELMERGAAGGTSADASPAYLAAARSEAVARGYADRVRYLEGDIVEMAAGIDPSDVVTLDRVVCCYPDMPAMLRAAAPLARRVLGMVIPRGTRLVRSGVALVNLFQRIRRHPFRVFVHDPGQIEAVLAGQGMSRRHVRDGFLWRVVVFGREGGGPA